MELVLSSVKNEYASIGSGKQKMLLLGSIIEVKTDNKNERNSYIPPSIKDSVNRKLKQIGFKSHTNVFKWGFGKYSKNTVFIHLNLSKIDLYSNTDVLNTLWYF